jgi:hypothetical protein
VNRAEAREIAEGQLRRYPELGTAVGQVLDFEEILSRPPCVYGVTEEMMRSCWIAYLVGPLSGRALTSSEVIIISNTTGRIIYAGSANDEG